MRDRPFGTLAANLLSIGARGLGVFLYWALRITYRPNERRIALMVLAGVAALALLVWALSR